MGCWKGFLRWICSCCCCGRDDDDNDNCLGFWQKDPPRNKLGALSQSSARGARTSAFTEQFQSSEQPSSSIELMPIPNNSGCGCGMDNCNHTICGTKGIYAITEESSTAAASRKSNVDDISPTSRSVPLGYSPPESMTATGPSNNTPRHEDPDTRSTPGLPRSPPEEEGAILAKYGAAVEPVDDSVSLTSASTVTASTLREDSQADVQQTLQREQSLTSTSSVSSESTPILKNVSPLDIAIKRTEQEWLGKFYPELRIISGSLRFPTHSQGSQRKRRPASKVMPQMPQGQRDRLDRFLSKDQHNWQSIKGIATWHATHKTTYIQELQPAGQGLGHNWYEDVCRQNGLQGRRLNCRSEPSASGTPRSIMCQEAPWR